MRHEFRGTIANMIEEIEAHKQSLKRKLTNGKPREHHPDEEPFDDMKLRQEIANLEGQELRAKEFSSFDDDRCHFCYIRENRVSQLKPGRPISGLIDRLDCPTCGFGISIIN